MNTEGFIQLKSDNGKGKNIMKKLLRLILLTCFTLLLAGGLYNTLAYFSTPERNGVTPTYLNAFPTAMPDVVIDLLVYAPKS
jgi:DNA gyrase/topoisomerase IV subunit B